MPCGRQRWLQDFFFFLVVAAGNDYMIIYRSLLNAHMFNNEAGTPRVCSRED